MAEPMKITSVYQDVAHAVFVERKKQPEGQKYRGFVLYGGSRSSKSWSIMQIILSYCYKYRDKNKDILIARQQYSDVKKTILKDFIEMLDLYGIYDSKCHYKSHPQAYRLYGNMVYFSGLDSGGAHGEKHNVIWINEAFEADVETFKQLNQRLQEFFILDYNPCFTEHWIKEVVMKRPDVFSHHSTFEANDYLEEAIKKELRSYDPNIPENVENGTADDYMYKVYTLGIGSERLGVIFPYVTWIDEFPKSLSYIYGLDLGYTTDPSAIVKVATAGRDLYIELLGYESTETSIILNEYMVSRGISRNTYIIADSSDKYISQKYGTVEMVKDLKALGWNISKVSKTEDIIYWIGKVKEHKIHIVKNDLYSQALKEQENYMWRTINGIQVSVPLDRYNHMWDAVRYALAGGKQSRRKRIW
jgi:phage terminase large subunit